MGIIMIPAQQGCCEPYIIIAKKCLLLLLPQLLLLPSKHHTIIKSARKADSTLFSGWQRLPKKAFSPPFPRLSPRTTFHILETNNMNNTEATLDGRKRVGFRNNIKPTSSKVDPGCQDTLGTGKVAGSLGSVPQDSPSPGDFSPISLVHLWRMGAWFYWEYQ